MNAYSLIQETNLLHCFWGTTHMCIYLTSGKIKGGCEKWSNGGGQVSNYEGFTYHAESTEFYHEVLGATGKSGPVSNMTIFKF